MPRGQTQGTVPALCSEPDRRTRGLRRRRMVERLLQLEVPAPERRRATRKQLAQHLEGLLQDGEPFPNRPEPVPEGPELVLVPSRADPEIKPAPREEVHGGRSLG